MTVASTHEDQLLAPVELLLAEVDDRVAVLEAASSRAGGFDVREYWRRFHLSPRIRANEALAAAERVVALLSNIAIPLPLALSALARERLPHLSRRTAGAYYTDFRLAQYLAGLSRDAMDGRVIDPASGSGVLLAAVVMAACGSDRVRTASWLRDRVYAADRSAAALRGARLALASMVDDLDAIDEMNSHWRRHDSLLAGVPERGFDLVIANPPWEKLKLSRHEYIQSLGGERHYGADYDSSALRAYEAGLEQVSSYAMQLLERYPLLRNGEPDLYRAFLELMFRLAGSGGRLSVLVPAGLIRSQSTEELRQLLLGRTSGLRLVVMENRARFFAIDSRFKFLALTARVAKKGARAFEVAHAAPSESSVRIPIRQLQAMRPDLTVPEVRGPAEWRVLRAIYRHSQRWSDVPPRWQPTIVRELDMTRDRALFSRHRSSGALPIVEGRMVNQYLFGAKAYASGSGRRAQWTPLPFGDAATAPQFWCKKDSLPERTLQRAFRERLGFCDTTGQTNERAILAAPIPAGVVCGNKVPTISFGDEDEVQRLRFLALLNSFAFDWVARRVITTTVNYFLLRSLPVPASLMEETIATRRLADDARKLVRLASAGSSRDTMLAAAALRATIDATIFKAYGLDLDDAALIMNDFPLLDRGQPPIAGETRSTITRDFVLARAADLHRSKVTDWHRRRDEAMCGGAIPYIPSESMLRGAVAAAFRSPARPSRSAASPGAAALHALRRT
ncbi:MAG TPA: N-6 DNA methylase [Thermoanaerobaculia bacterium]